MRRSGVGSGGGIGMNKNVQVPVKSGSGSKGISAGWAGQRGQAQSNHVTEQGGKSTGYRGEPKFTGKNFQPGPFGNEVALNVGKGGPGTGRNVMGCGSQGTHGPVVQGGPPIANTKNQWPDSRS
jgi:hypothetical protein